MAIAISELSGHRLSFTQLYLIVIIEIVSLENRMIFKSFILKIHCTIGTEAHPFRDANPVVFSIGGIIHIDTQQVRISCQTQCSEIFIVAIV